MAININSSLQAAFDRKGLFVSTWLGIVIVVRLELRS
jgi:hypothetical protein